MTATILPFGETRAPSLDPIIDLTAGAMNAVNAVIVERMQSAAALRRARAGAQIAAAAR